MRNVRFLFAFVDFQLLNVIYYKKIKVTSSKVVVRKRKGERDR